jgi:hypothetical protein
MQTDSRKRNEFKSFSILKAELNPMSMPERKFVIMKYVNKVPSLGSCSYCQRKFFTPNSYHGHPSGAEQHLLGKFYEHKCGGDPNVIPR